MLHYILVSFIYFQSAMSSEPMVIGTKTDGVLYDSMKACEASIPRARITYTRDWLIVNTFEEGYKWEVPQCQELEINGR